jgi:hypothetical protein
MSPAKCDVVICRFRVFENLSKSATGHTNSTSQSHTIHISSSSSRHLQNIALPPTSHNHTLHPGHRFILHARHEIKSTLSLADPGLAGRPPLRRRRELGLDDGRLGVLCVLEHGGVVDGLVVGGALHVPESGWGGGDGEGGDAEGQEGG